MNRNHNLHIVIRREYLERIKKKSFWLMTFLIPALFLSLLAIPFLIPESTDTKLIAVRDNVLKEKLVNDENIVFFHVESEDYNHLLTEYPEISGLLIIPDDILLSKKPELKFYCESAVTAFFEKALKNKVLDVVQQVKIENSGIDNLKEIISSVRPDIDIHFYEVSLGATNKTDSSVLASLSYVAALLIYMFILLYSASVLQGVIEEKQNRVFELLLVSVKPFDLMMGKIIGVALAAFTQLLLWAVIVLLAVPYDMILSYVDLKTAMMLLSTFLLWLVGGYLLYASCFAAIGSAATDNGRDTQQLQLPVTIPLVAALLVVFAVFQNPDSDVAVWFSIIPFTSPIVMICRLPYGVPVWQWLMSLILLYGTFTLTTWLASRIYRKCILQSGKVSIFKS